MKTLKEILQDPELDTDDHVTELLYGEPLTYDERWATPVTTALHEQGTIAECMSQHGGEGEGDSIWAVYKTTETDGTTRYWEVSGYYASHHGADFQGIEEVEPVEVTKIEYKAVAK